MSQVISQVVPDGYKQTEVGIIPNDWKISKLGNIGKFKNGINKDAGSFGHGLPFINLMDVFGKSHISGDEKFGLIDSNEVERKEYNIKVSDVLFIRSSVKPSGVGLTSVALQDVKDAVYSGFMIRYRSKGELDTGFKKHCFYDSGFRGRLIAASTVSANTNINQEALKELQIVYPSNIKEQTAIANALSDVDALLSELDKLIAKKQAIKTATMQQLLTGKTRLPQFATYTDGDKQGQTKGTQPSELGEIPEDWEVKTIGSVVSITTGSRNTQDKLSNGLYPFFVRSQTIERIDTYSFDGEAVLTAGDGVGTGKIFHYINGKFDYHQRVYLMHNFGERIDGYYFYIYFSNFFYDRIMSMTAKSSVDSVRREMIADMFITLPSKQEQTAIATILSDMDEEIQALKQRLSKTRQIKQGMMQELLTGKTRLPFEKSGDMKSQGDPNAD